MAKTTGGIPRLFARHRQLLALLDALGGRAGNLDFQKLLLLYCEEPGAHRAYDFVPYRFGAFSFTSYSDRRKLIGHGLLAEDDTHWELTAEGRRVVGAAMDMHLLGFVSRHQNLRGDALVAETYRRLPYYATRSEIADRVLRGDAAALRRIDEARPAPSGSPLSTIGYEGRSLESYLNTLMRSSVTVLCDVRRNPISRKYGFSKATLATSCEKVGIRYEHIPELGIASEKRRQLETQEDYDELFAAYKRDSLPKQSESIAKIYQWLVAGERVALTCYEELSQQCHRGCVAEALVATASEALEAQHL
jgi:hypothetical protein